ncbi:MAG: molybdopterin-dependent oxidoreductase [Gordonibacter sp.]
METRYSTCVFCDGGCAVKAEFEGDCMRVGPADRAFPAFCSKARLIDEYRLHPDRLTKPLKNVGERGNPSWQEISWDQALDEIAERLHTVVETYGAPAVAFAEMPLNVGFGGITRRFMSRLGSPNYTAPTALCMGNTAQVHRAAYGWFSLPNWEATDCVVYFGQHRDEERWPAEYLALKGALARGASLIVVDPRETPTAKLATHHLRIRYGTDAALALGWLHVIIEEGLYDRAFVESQCLGFDDLAQRVAAYPPARVAEICGIDEEAVCTTARVYARAHAAIIPWGVVGDMQRNSTSLLQAQCALRAICGFLNTSERVLGPSVGGVTNAELSRFDWLPADKRALQLGCDTHPLLTFAASSLYREANERAGVPYEPDILAESCSCDPATLFRAMRGEGPYPVKALFSVANNTTMSYAGQQGIVDAFMGQDLVVVFEHWMTPTACLADYVLPGDMWAERDVLGSAFDVGPGFVAGQAFREPVGACKNWYYVVKGLADRLGFAEDFPWEDEHALYDWRLAPLGVTWDDLVRQGGAANELVAIGKFVTPSGSVELKSSVLEQLGFDPLPAYEEPTDPASDGTYPYILFAGSRDRKSYNTNLHQIPSLRAEEPEPRLFINPADTRDEALEEGQWCVVESAYGQVELMVHLDEAQPVGTLRIPHGWWKPEAATSQAKLESACLHNDGMLFPDADWNLDPAQGVPNLRGGIHGRVRARSSLSSAASAEGD